MRLALVPAALLRCGTALAMLSKPAMRPEFDMERQDLQLARDLPDRLYVKEPWDRDLVPEVFYTSRVRNYSYSPFDIETMNVQYSDCPHYQVVSRHKQYEESWDSILKTLSQVPVGMRQWTGNLLFLPEGSTSAFQWRSTLTFTKNLFTLGVAAHEFSHVLDQYALADVVEEHGYRVGTRYSHTVMWADAYNNDSATATPYGRTSWIENFADAGRFAISDMTIPGGIISWHRNWSAIAAQNADYRQRLERVIFPAGFPRAGVCTAKVPSAPAVSKHTGKESDGEGAMSGAERRRWTKSRADAVPAGAEDIPFIILPEFDSEPVVYEGP